MNRMGLFKDEYYQFLLTCHFGYIIKCVQYQSQAQLYNNCGHSFPPTNTNTHQTTLPFNFHQMYLSLQPVMKGLNLLLRIPLYSIIYRFHQMYKLPHRSFPLTHTAFFYGTISQMIFSLTLIS